MRTVGITGVTGYLGSRLRSAFAAEGWRTVGLTRRPGRDDRQFALGEQVKPSTLGGLDLLVHAAYDMQAITEDEIWDTNVTGTRILLDAACTTGVERIIVLSSMSAYEGTRQRYGRAKLAIEAMALAAGAAAVRPGLVLGPRPGGMGGTLARMCRLPLTPSLVGVGHQFPLTEEDFVAGMLLLAGAESMPTTTVGLAHPTPLAFPDLLRAIAHRIGIRPPRLVPVPWQVVDAAIRSGERIGANLPLRSDSLLGLRFPAPSVPNAEIWAGMGLRLHPVLPA